LRDYSVCAKIRGKFCMMLFCIIIFKICGFWRNPLNYSRLYWKMWMKRDEKRAEIGLIGDRTIFIRGQLFGVVKVLIHKGLW